MKGLSEIVNEVRESGKKYKGELPKGVKEVSPSKKVISAGRKIKLPHPFPVVKLSEPLEQDILISAAQSRKYEVEIIKNRDGVMVAIYKVEKLSGGGSHKSSHSSFYEGEKEILCMGGDTEHHQIEMLEVYLQEKYEGGG